MTSSTVASGAEIGTLNVGTASHLRGRSGHEYLAVEQNRNAHRKSEDGLHVVLDQHNRAMLFEVSQSIDHRSSLVRPNAGHGFIEQQQGWLQCHCHRNLEPPLLAMGEFGSPDVGPRLQPNSLKSQHGAV